MEEKELSVIIQNVLKYEDKKEPGKFKTRLGYVVNSADAYQENTNFKGLSELSIFLNTTKAFDSLNLSHMGKSATLYFIEKVSPFNPLKTYMDLTKIKVKDEVINLL